ncbi:3BETAHSD/D1 [Symbiodinium pilosum]|uniref:3BETAHSD/D1 protein n=1 Tax=Symbiodinium pilosum TaxID=2952 RepID=A0A812QNE3_SYMPI|nr:3BETAHSD/D1 [Symbiodinium pilosum]
MAGQVQQKSMSGGQANESGKYGPVPKRCVVTGGLGFVGQRLVETLVERGAEQVVSFDIVPPAANVWQHKAIKYVTADLCDYDAVLKAVEGADCVWHNAAAVGPFLPKHFYKNVNVIGTRNVLEACKQQGVRKLVFSATPSSRFTCTDDVDGKTEAEMPDIPQECYVAEYSATKAEGELLLRKACKEDEILFVAVAPHTVYGPRDNLFLPNLLEAAGVGKLRIFGSGTSRVGYTHVDNYCHGLVIAEKQLYQGSPHLGKFYVCTDGPTHPHAEGYSVFWEELDQAVTGMGFDSLYSKTALPYFLLRIIAFICDVISTMTGKKLKLGWFTLRMLTMHRWFRITAAQNDLGYQPVVSYKDGWPDTIEWFRNKWLPTFDPKTASGTTGGIAQQTVDKVKIQEQKMQK